MIIITNKKNGYITLMSVLVVGAIGVAIATSLLLLGLGALRTSFTIEQSNQAKGLATACSEKALQQIRNSTSFSGTGTIILGQGTCGYSVSAGSGENRTVVASGTVGTITRKINISVTNINPTITISSWQEVAD